MHEQIERFLSGISLKNSERKARQMVAEHFGGILTSHYRYVRIDGIEYRITKNPEAECGWNIEEMNWDHGDDWRFFSPY